MARVEHSPYRRAASVVVILDFNLFCVSAYVRLHGDHIKDALERIRFALDGLRDKEPIS